MQTSFSFGMFLDLDTASVAASIAACFLSSESGAGVTGAEGGACEGDTVGEDGVEGAGGGAATEAGDGDEAVTAGAGAGEVLGACGAIGFTGAFGFSEEASGLLHGFRDLFLLELRRLFLSFLLLLLLFEGLLPSPEGRGVKSPPTGLGALPKVGGPWPLPCCASPACI